MKILARPILENLKREHPDVAKRLDAWCQDVEIASWSSPHEVKERYNKTVDFPGNNLAIFNLKGNQYRIAARIHYNRGLVIIEKAGTHNEYIKWRLK
jgi:mRNA interferase HigB